LLRNPKWRDVKGENALVHRCDDPEYEYHYREAVDEYKKKYNKEGDADFLVRNAQEVEEVLALLPKPSSQYFQRESIALIFETLGVISKKLNTPRPLEIMKSRVQNLGDDRCDV
jgi:hypothetical protein